MTLQKGRPKHTTGQAITLTDKELKRVESVIASGHNPIRNQALLTLSFKLGLRIKELASLNIDDVYQDGKTKPTLHLTSDMTKGAKHRASLSPILKSLPIYLHLSNSVNPKT